MRVLEVYPSRALSLVCEVALKYALLAQPTKKTKRNFYPASEPMKTDLNLEGLLKYMIPFPLTSIL